MLWNKSIFAKENVFYLEYKLDSSNALIETLTKENIAIFVVLKHIQSNNLFLCVCTHLLFNKNRGDIKLTQIDLLSRTITCIKREYNNKIGNVILGCDLNSSPNSGIYDYITKGEVDCLYVDRKQTSGQFLCEFDFKGLKMFKECLRRKQNVSSEYAIENNREWFIWLKNTNIIMSRDKEKITLVYNDDNNSDCKLMLVNENKLTSAYWYINTYYINTNRDLHINEDELNENEITYYSEKYCGTFDYIFYSGNNITPTRKLFIPSFNTMYSNKSNIPNANHPSDHFILSIDFELLFN